MLEIKAAAKTFGKDTIFRDFSLSLDAGQFKVLLGPSGCGKSTLLDALCGVSPLDIGQIIWQGRRLDHVREQAAYMQQKDLLLPWLTLMENCLLPARTGRRSRSRAEALEEGIRFFDRLGLKGFESHLPGQVSGGMRQRCALARTLMFKRELILLDEPLSALDAITRQQLQDLLLMLQSEFGKTILMITHDIDEALGLGDEILLLSPRPMKIVDRFTPPPPKPRAFNHPQVMAVKAQVMDRLKGDSNEAAG